MVVWMHEQPMNEGRTYLAKHTTRTVRASVRKIRHRVDIQSIGHQQTSQLQMNDIAEVEFAASLPLFFDAYADNREMGALFLIDPLTNATVGAAMIVGAVDESGHDATSEERDRFGEQEAALVWLRGREQEAVELRDRIRQAGRAAVILDDRLIPDASLPAAMRALQLAKVTGISSRSELSHSTLAALRELAGPRFYTTTEAAATLAHAWTSQEAQR
jgi:bifunctional enzyme CysN/CysC/sulfate adenylyltransferase subunit 1